MNVELKLTMTEKMAIAVHTAAVQRSMSVIAFINMVLRDFLLEAAAHSGVAHACCFCRDADTNQGGLARCCACDGWGQAFTVSRNGGVRSLTKAS